MGDEAIPNNENTKLNSAQKQFLEYYLPHNEAVKELLEDCIKNNNYSQYLM
jgi:hypothetical protein